MTRLLFSSVLKKEYRQELEALIFFNPQQERVRAGILRCIENYGRPRIDTEGDRLRVQVEGFFNVQSLFAFDKVGGTDCLVGLVVYVRSDIENLVVLHVAVSEKYAASGSLCSELLVMKLFVQLREIARCLKGLRAVRLAYQSDLPISRANEQHADARPTIHADNS